MNIAPSFHALNIEQLAKSTDGHSEWLWEGFLMPGCLTLLTSQWKSGKTTLVSILLSKMHAGGTLFDRSVRVGRATIVSEEAPAMWLQRGRVLRFGDNVGLICRPFARRPTTDDWNALIESLIQTHDDSGLDLVVIDSLAAFLPCRSENEAGGMLDALLPLQRLTALGIAVLVLHHPKKGEVLPGQASRGSGALPSSVDVLLEMYWQGRAFNADRHRRILGFSRFEETPRRLLIELNETRSDYTVQEDEDIDDTSRDLRALHAILKEAQEPLTRREILAMWPEESDRPDDATLWRWLDRAVNQGLVTQEGSGKRGSPFRYSS